MSSIWKRDADLVIEPNVDGFTYDGFDRAKDLIVPARNSIRETAAGDQGLDEGRGNTAWARPRDVTAVPTVSAADRATHRPVFRLSDLVVTNGSYFRAPLGVPLVYAVGSAARQLRLQLSAAQDQPLP